MTAQEPRPSPQRDGEKPPLPPPPPPRKDRGSLEDLAYALQIAKTEIEQLRAALGYLSEKNDGNASWAKRMESEVDRLAAERDGAKAENVRLREEVARLTGERDEARAVARWLYESIGKTGRHVLNLVSPGSLDSWPWLRGEQPSTEETT